LSQTISLQVTYDYSCLVCGSHGICFNPLMPETLAFIPTHAAALARMTEFLPDAGRYAADRNFVRPGHPNISRLSP